MTPSYLCFPVAFALFQALWHLYFKDGAVSGATYAVVWVWLAILGAWTLQILRDQATHLRTLEKELGRLRRPADPSLSNRFAVTDR